MQQNWAQLGEPERAALCQLACTGKDASYHTALSVWIQSTLDQLVWNCISSHALARMRLITLCCLSEYSLHWISLFETETASARMHWQGCVLSHCAVCLNTVYTGSACLKLKVLLIHRYVKHLFPHNSHPFPQWQRNLPANKTSVWFRINMYY